MTALLQSAEGIGAEIVARVATRTVAQGAETDLGLAVYRGRRVIDDDLVPCTALIEGSDEVVETESRGLNTTKIEATVNQQYVLLAYVPCDPAHPNDAAHAALRDLKRAMFTTGGKPDRTLGGAVRRLRYRGRDIGPRGDGAAFVVVSLEVAVEYVEDLSNP